MKGYPLARLLHVRMLRETSARAAVSLCRERLHEAEAQAAEAEQVWQEYRSQRPAREAALFEGIRGRVVEQSEMDRYHAKRATLTARELELEDSFRQAQKRRDEALLLLEKAQEVLRTASQKVRKFEEHRARWQQEEGKRQERAEEREQEN